MGNARSRIDFEQGAKIREPLMILLETDWQVSSDWMQGIVQSYFVGARRALRSIETV